MKKIFNKYLLLLLIPLGFILGKFRERQIENYQASIGQPTMSGAFALIGITALGICSGIALFFIALIQSNKMLTRKEKDIVILIIMLISVPIIILISLFLGF